MLTPEPELQQRIAELFRQEDADSSDLAPLLDPFQYIASANYVVPMLLHLAIKRGNEIVDHVPAYSSLDHAVNWQALASTIARFEVFVGPYFESALISDPFAEELLSYEERKHHRRHLIASFEQALWQLCSDHDGLRVSLAKPVRRSALHLVSQIAERALCPPGLTELIDRRPEERDLRELALTTDTFVLEIFSQSAPKSWASLCAGLGFPMEMIPQFRSWVLDTGMTARRWFSMEHLWDDWVAFAVENGFDHRTRQQFEALVDLHTVTPEEAVSWGVQAPFLRCGHFLALWFFAFHVLHPDLGFLSLLIRRHEQLWSSTVGSTLAFAADWLGRQLPAYSRLAWVARRSRRDVGDADLVLWDRETDDVVVLELKTTFDKFRSHAQLRNFVEQRVNFPKATAQARRAAAVIGDGTWSLRELFRTAAPVRPRSVTPGVLTWWDTFNPTLGSADEVLCCNFATFVHVLSAAKGDLAAAITAVRELSTIYCPGILIPGHVSVGGQRRSLRREVQCAELPPATTWEHVSTLTANLLIPLRRWPSDWHDRGEDVRGDLFVYEDTE